MLDTSGTFININLCESELFNLRADNNVVCQFPFLFFYSYLWLGRGLDIDGEDKHKSQASTYASSAYSQNSSLHAHNISITRFGKVLA